MIININRNIFWRLIKEGHKDFIVIDKNIKIEGESYYYPNYYRMPSSIRFNLYSEGTTLSYVLGEYPCRLFIDISYHTPNTLRK